ncbi:MAG: GNAT family N-acetyltransferase, partial [Dehalococcoidia bacterium]|nr:GNAT family N-acetyltransferase [Dehalococcoidia bacterium]
IEEFDSSFSTDCVWQMDQKIVGDEVSTTFRAIHLPRAIKVDPRRDNNWLENWQNRDLLIAVEEDGELTGYLHMDVDRSRNVGRVEHLAVSRKRRRLGSGTALIQEAKRWSRVRRMRALAVETDTRNYPAINFFQKSGFAFCGFNDSYHSNKDISVFFVCTLG